MFIQMVQFYGLGLICALIFLLVVASVWLLWRMRRKLDKTAKERQAFLYDVIIISVITAPILAFAFTALLVMFRA